MGDDEPNEQGTLVYFHLSDSSPVAEEELLLSDGSKAKVLWKDVLVEGEYPMSPTANGASHKPMRVVASGGSSEKDRTICMSDVIAAHEGEAFKYVTIPKSHKDKLEENTGYVPRPQGLRIAEKKGKKVLQAALGFTEPDIKGKVSRGTIPDVSGGFFFGFTNKHQAKKWPCAMKHVALTGVPFMGNLDPFPAIFASDDEIPEDVNVEHYYFDGASAVADPPKEEEAKGDVVWTEESGMNWIRESINSALSPDREYVDDGRPRTPQPYYYVQDVSATAALVEESFRGNRTRFVIPYTISEGKISLSPQLRWQEVREAMIAASDKDFDEFSPEKVKEKLSLQLSDIEGDFSVDAVSMDRRARIVNSSGKSWVANFAVEADGGLWLAEPSAWERVESAPDEKPDPAKEKAPASTTMLSDTTTTGTSDPMMDRLEIARANRRQLMPSSN